MDAFSANMKKSDFFTKQQLSILTSYNRKIKKSREDMAIFCLFHAKKQFHGTIEQNLPIRYTVFMSNFFYSIVIYPLTQIIELVFTFCNKLFDNEGFALIGVSIAVSMLTLPLYIVAENWQQIERDKQAFMKKQVDRIKKAFKGNEQYMILTTYYKMNGYHPIMGLRSAFGLLIQIPFFTAAYSCLSTMEALKGKSFFFISDMGAPDSTFFIGTFAVNILPIAMTLINIIASAIYLKGLGIRDKIQTYALALLFLALLYGSPSGLVIYWTMNNIFSLVKNVFYKLKNPAKTLYYISCMAVTAAILYILIGKPVSFKRGILISVVFAMIYFIPLFIRLANYFVDTVMKPLRDDFGKRLWLFILSSSSLALMLGLFIPTNLISSSPIEFSGIDGYGSPMFFVWNTFFQAAGLCIAWPLMIYFLFKERIQTLISSGLFILLMLSVINIFGFSGNYGSLSKLLTFTDVSTVDSKVSSIAVNALVLLASCAVLIALFRTKASKFYSPFAGMTLACFMAFSFINIAKINSGYKEYLKLSASGKTAGEMEKVFEFSREGKNVLLIFLDRTQGHYIEPLFEECPELQEEMTGFTLYRNTVSYNSHTLMASPACYGGYEYTPFEINRKSEKTLCEKQNESILMLPRIFTEQFGYKATVADPQWANYSWIPDLSIFSGLPKTKAVNLEGKYLPLWYKEHQDTAKISVTSDTLKRNILWYGLFRSSPLALRPAFYNDGNYWSTNSKNEDYDDYIAGYSTLEYLPRLSSFDGKENSFITMSNESTHQSMILQSPEYRPVSSVVKMEKRNEFSNDGAYNSVAGAMKRLGEFFELLKEKGCYDNTRIIMYADHGNTSRESGFKWNEKFDRIKPGKYHPMLMVKDFGQRGNLMVSDEFMTNADVPYLATKDLGNEALNPFSGNKISMDEKENGALVCISNMFMPHHVKSKNIFTAEKNEWYRVRDDIFNPENWIQEEK